MLSFYQHQARTHTHTHILTEGQPNDENKRLIEIDGRKKWKFALNIDAYEAGDVIKTSTYTYYVSAFVFLLFGCGEEQMSKLGIAINHMINA